ncbi:MAG: hypothetical protein JSV10_03395 [Candidatus Zixiibacteriota bacterium]|nr:MAG: hypothetical protein JSV10_03395 [candidate division Zixibacteria bacterium]
MEPERRYIEEVGEAVEALGIMLEKELGEIRQGLAGLYQSVNRISNEEKDLSQELQKLREEVKAMDGFLRGVESIMSRTESRLTDLQKAYSDEEDIAGEIKNDLLVMKRGLQFLRSDLKELLERQGKAEKVLEGERAEREGAEERKPPDITT